MPTAIATELRTPARRFALIGLALGLAFYGFVRLPWVEASAVLPITRLQGRAATLVSGMPALPVDVTIACSGMDLMALCLGAVLAYPVRWRARAAGAIAGVLLILALNTARIATLGLAASSPRWFTALHLYVWPAALVLAVAGYVVWWMRLDGASRPLPHARFAVALAASAAVFVAVSAASADGAWVQSTAAFVARAAAFLLSGAGMAASATGNILATPRGRFQVTSECILTPLMPVYVAAVAAYVRGWRRRMPWLVAAPAVFVTLGIARLLVIVLPAAAGSTLFLIHAFSQLLVACVLVCGVAWWRHRSGAQLWLRAPFGLLAGALCLYALHAAGSAMLRVPRTADDQGALALLPAFQLAFAAALWIAWSAPREWRVFALGMTALAVSQAAIFAVVDAARLTPAIPAVRAWAIAGPLVVAALVDRHARSRI